ncbi:MAG: hypothetical protein QXP31_06350 [Pyrobaculum sp.]
MYSVQAVWGSCISSEVAEWRLSMRVVWTIDMPLGGRAAYAGEGLGYAVRKSFSLSNSFKTASRCS